MNEQLERERQRLQQAWARYVIQGSSALRPQESEEPDPVEPEPAGPVQNEVVESWKRSSLTVPPERVSAPVPDERAAEQAWQQSPLEFAARGLLPELRRLAEQADLMIAIGNADGQLMWTAGSDRMHQLARGINFVPGGCWDEGSVGTNALALALRKREPVQVFAAEHYVMAVHDWVCYSSPIRDTHSGELLGVLDISTTWDRHTPLGMTGTMHYVQRIEQGLGLRPASAGTLTLKLCGTPQVTYGGRTLNLTPRQNELLAVLALHEGGLTLDALHAHIYGDQMVSLSTLKSEVSTLRSLLHGQIGSRPYRLTLNVTFDVQTIEGHLLAGEVGKVLDLYDGPLLPGSSSPLLSYWRDYLDGAVRESVCRTRNAELLWRYASRFDDLESLDLLEEVLPEHDHRLPVVRARRAALEVAF